MSGRYTPPPDEPDGVTHTPKEVSDTETERQKFDDWLAYRHWLVYGEITYGFLALCVWARCS